VSTGRLPSRQTTALSFLVLMAVPTLSHLAICSGVPVRSGWRMSSPRPPKHGEIPYEISLPQLQDPQNLNYSPGPDGLVAVVKTDAAHHPHIYLQDSTSASPRLLIDRIANKPKWSPQGKRIACTVWKSLDRPWNLCIVTLGKPDTLYPSFSAHTVRYRWSPDAKYLAVQGTLYNEDRSVLVVVETSQGTATVLDSLQLLSDYEFSWAPDSRKLAVSRPTRLADVEQVAEAELWIFDVSGNGAKVVRSAGHLQRNPQWIDDTRVLFSQEGLGGQPGQALVVEISRQTSRR
jgi:Tol biopolymer transport system component